jgi:hypothetical protein
LVRWTDRGQWRLHGTQLDKVDLSSLRSQESDAHSANSQIVQEMLIEADFHIQTTPSIEPPDCSIEKLSRQRLVFLKQGHQLQALLTSRRSCG